MIDCPAPTRLPARPCPAAARVMAKAAPHPVTPFPRGPHGPLRAFRVSARQVPGAAMGNVYPWGTLSARPHGQPGPGVLADHGTTRAKEDAGASAFVRAATPQALRMKAALPCDTPFDGPRRPC